MLSKGMFHFETCPFFMREFSMRALVYTVMMYLGSVTLAQAARVDVNRLRTTIHTLASQEFQGRAPGSRGHRLTQDYLLAQLRSYGYAPAVAKEKSWQPWKGPIENITAVKSAGKPSGARKCIAFAAHYDHNPPMGGRYSPGANDNASGVAVLLEVARLLQNESLALDADVYFTFPDQEENFVQGSRFIAESLKRTCSQVLFSVTLDMVGAPFFPGFGNRLFALGSESSDSLFHLVKRVRERENSVTALQSGIFLIEPLGRWMPRSDYASFRSEGIPFLFLTTGITPQYHTPDDTEEHLDFGLVRGVTEWTLELLLEYARGFQRKSFFMQDGNRFASSEELARQARDATELLELMLSKSSENALTPQEIEFLKSRIDAWKSGKYPSVWELKWTSIRLMQIVSRKAPLRWAYLRSLWGKLL